MVLLTFSFGLSITEFVFLLFNETGSCYVDTA